MPARPEGGAEDAAAASQSPINGAAPDGRMRATIGALPPARPLSKKRTKNGRSEPTNTTFDPLASLPQPVPSRPRLAWEHVSEDPLSSAAKRLVAGVFCIRSAKRGHVYFGGGWDLVRLHKEEFAALQAGNHEHRALSRDVERDGITSVDYWVVRKMSLQVDGVKASEDSLAMAIAEERGKVRQSSGSQPYPSSHKRVQTNPLHATPRPRHKPLPTLPRPTAPQRPVCGHAARQGHALPRTLLEAPLLGGTHAPRPPPTRARALLRGGRDSTDLPRPTRPSARTPFQPTAVSVPDCDLDAESLSRRPLP